MSELNVPETAAVSAASTRDAKPAAETAVVPGKKRRLAAVAVVLALAAIAVWYFAIREREPKNDLERFQGEWQIAVGTGGETRETSNAVRVTGDRWEYVTGTLNKACRITVNESASPKQIDLEVIDTAGLVGLPIKMHGVYVFDSKEKVRMRVNPVREPRPTSLDDPDAIVWVLTKVKLESDSQPKK